MDEDRKSGKQEMMTANDNDRGIKKKTKRWTKKKKQKNNEWDFKIQHAVKKKNRKKKKRKIGKVE